MCIISSIITAPIVDTDVGYANWEQDAADEIERQFYAFHESHKSLHR